MSDEAEQSGAGGDGRVHRRRRRWSEARKRRIVAESYQPGVSVSVVARRHDVNANQVFGWRRQYRELARAVGGFVPVVVSSARRLGLIDEGFTAGLAGGEVTAFRLCRPARGRRHSSEYSRNSPPGKHFDRVPSALRPRAISAMRGFVETASSRRCSASPGSRCAVLTR